MADGIKGYVVDDINNINIPKSPDGWPQNGPYAIR